MADKGIQKEFLFIGVAAVCGVLAAFLVNNYVNSHIEYYQSQLTDVIEVVSLKKDLRKGRTIPAAELEPKRVPRAFFHQKMIKWDEHKLVIDRRVNTNIVAGEVLLWYDLGTAVHSSPTDMLEEGQRAITIPIDDVTGMGGLLRPNTRVDIYGTFKVKDKARKGERAASKLLAARVLPNTLVIAVGSKWGTQDQAVAERQKGMLGLGMAGGQAGASTVTILVEEDKVERLLLAQELCMQGGTNLYCIMRSSLEVDAAKEEQPRTPVTQDDFIGQVIQPELEARTVERTEEEKDTERRSNENAEALKDLLKQSGL